MSFSKHILMDDYISISPLIKSLCNEMMEWEGLAFTWLFSVDQDRDSMYYKVKLHIAPQTQTNVIQVQSVFGGVWGSQTSQNTYLVCRKISCSHHHEYLSIHPFLVTSHDGLSLSVPNISLHAFEQLTNLILMKLTDNHWLDFSETLALSLTGYGKLTCF